MKVEFFAQEYNKDTLFREVKYLFERDDVGWKIFRNRDLYMKLGIEKKFMKDLFNRSGV